jgi:hypothetical protein
MKANIDKKKMPAYLRKSIFTIRIREYYSFINPSGIYEVLLGIVGIPLIFEQSPLLSIIKE